MVGHGPAEHPEPTGVPQMGWLYRGEAVLSARQGHHQHRGLQLLQGMGCWVGGHGGGLSQVPSGCRMEILVG